MNVDVYLYLIIFKYVNKDTLTHCHGYLYASACAHSHTTVLFAFKSPSCFYSTVRICPK